MRRRDGCNMEDSINCNMDGIIERKGVQNSPTITKDVHEYFVKYVNKSENVLSWQHNVLG